MELPKNVTQMGENTGQCKIYVEDYVFSYIKQINQTAADKPKAVALYGVKKQEEEYTYRDEAADDDFGSLFSDDELDEIVNWLFGE